MSRRCLVVLLFVLLAGCAGRGAQGFDPAAVHSVRVNGADLAYAVRGAGPPLLLVMGYGGTMDVWDPVLVDRLARTRTVICFDNRNVGRSGTSPEPVTLALMARDGLGLLQALGIERADVLGWSMGSMIAQEMALIRPGVVGKLVLYGTVCRPAAVRAALAPFAGVTPEAFLAMLFPRPWAEAHPDVWKRLPVPAIPATAAAMDRQRAAMFAWPGTEDRLSGLRCPTLVVAGEADTVTPAAEGAAMAARIPGAWLARFGGAGHWLMYQTPGDLARVVETFLSVDQNL